MVDIPRPTPAAPPTIFRRPDINGVSTDWDTLQSMTARDTALSARHAAGLTPRTPTPRMGWPKTSAAVDVRTACYILGKALAVAHST